MTKDDYRAAIVSVRPDLAGLPLTVHTGGWDSDAVEVGAIIFKFPKRPDAIPRLRKEAQLLALIRPRVPLTVPDMRLHEQPMVFSEHAKIPGEMIETPQYEVLTSPQRQAMADTLARFYAALHDIPTEAARGAGAGPKPSWPPGVEIMAEAEAILPAELHIWARDVLAAYDALPSGEEIFGYFDGHGWNMAFDHARGVLNGVYDFADAGLGPRARDLNYSSFISADLTDRLVSAYQDLTGFRIDRREVALHTAVQRLAELGEDQKSPGWFLANVVQWYDYMQSRPELRL
jgi:aminoglycoside phosphotransferase (APT) family kinase protein